MSTPYYQDEQVTLYHGDCRWFTEWLAGTVLVTDPPYGRGWKQGALKLSGSDAQPGIAGDEDTSVRDAVLALWDARTALVFGDPMLAPPPGTKLVGAYRKPPNAGTRGAIGGFRRDFEVFYLLGPWSAGLGGHSSIVATVTGSQGNPHSPQGKYGHPHAKPVDVMEQLVDACPPGVIADPFAGSGSTLVAARNLGRHAVGVEIEERYCEIAARRLSQGCAGAGGGPVNAAALTPTVTCRRPGCTEPVESRDHCQRHYRQRVRMRIYGYRDAGPAREHVNRLRQLGWTFEQIAEAAGVSTWVPHQLATGGTRWLWPESERAILAVPLASRASHRGVDGTGTYRRFEALQWMGWPMASIAAGLGLKPYTLCTLRSRGEPVSYRVAQAMVVLYEQLAHQAGPSQQTATKARRRGYAPPAAWDDIDDARARPRGVRKATVAVGPTRGGGPDAA